MAALVGAEGTAAVTAVLVETLVPAREVAL